MSSGAAPLENCHPGNGATHYYCICFSSLQHRNHFCNLQSLVPNSMLDSDSDENESDWIVPIDTAYLALEIGAGLAVPCTYCNAVDELTCIISSLYKGRTFTKEARRLVAVDVSRAIALLPAASASAREALQSLMTAVERTLPQAKRGALLRKHRQTLVLARRAGERYPAAAGVAADDSDNEEETAGFAQLPRECVDVILQHLGPVDLARAACVSRALRQAAANDALWRPLFALTFGKAAAAAAATSAPPGKKCAGDRDTATGCAPSR